jgi:hypothetical protein
METELCSTMKIGDIELPIVTLVEEGETAEIDEIKDPYKKLDVVPVKHKSAVNTLTITGFVNQKTHSDGLTLSEQKEELKSLRTNDVLDNDIDYKDFYGFLLVDTVNLDDNPDSRIVHEVEIESRYFPWPKYHRSESV